MAAQMLRRYGGSMLPAFGIGVVTGLFVKEAIDLLRARARRTQTQLEREGTMVFDQNMPEPLERREPAPAEGQPRFGGTGAIGFSPVAATAPSDEPDRH